MTRLVVKQMGDYTVYTRRDRMDSDVLIRPGPCAGAEVIVLWSGFTDYGHVLNIFTITEEQYNPVHGLKTWEQFEKWLDGVWPK